MSAIRQGATRYVVFILLSLFAGAARSAADWLDEMPTVPAVVQAVREKVEVDRQMNPASVGNEDYLAEQLAGTFILLRWVMMFELKEEGFWPTSVARQAKMDAISLSYQQAELAIGLGVGKRKGHVVRNCARRDSFSRARWPVLDECHRQTFLIGIRGIYPDATHRKAIFSRLFCDRGSHYLDLVQRWVLKAPRLVTPAETQKMPSGQSSIGLAFCEPYGGDANVNGLCDTWEKPLPASSGPAACGAQIELVGLKRIDSRRVRVEFIRPSGSEIPSVEFKLVRIDLDSGNQVSIPTVVEPGSWERASPVPCQKAVPPHPLLECRLEETVFDAAVRFTSNCINQRTCWPEQPREQACTTREALTLRTVKASLDLEPNSSQSWLRVAALSGGVQLGTATCKRPVLVPTFERFKRDLAAGRSVGLFGPYDDADQAAVAAEPVSRTYADEDSVWYQYREVGTMLVRQVVDKRVYLTQFVLGPWAIPYVSKGSFGPTEAGESLNRAFTHSCERVEDFQIIAITHTHPQGDNNFSEPDWLAAFCLRQQSDAATFRGSYLFRPDRCIDRIDGATPNLNDKFVRKNISTKDCPR